MVSLTAQGVASRLSMLAKLTDWQTCNASFRSRVSGGWRTDVRNANAPGMLGRLFVEYLHGTHGVPLDLEMQAVREAALAALDGAERVRV